LALLDESADGVFIIAATPFSDNCALDLESVDRMVDFYLERGANGLTVLGVMGEAPKLTEDESRALVRPTIARAGGAPIIVGVSAPGLASIGTLAASAMDAGAAGVMVAPPGHLRTNDQIFGYFDSVAETLVATPFACRIIRSPLRCGSRPR
jgi:4-hydroxy-tetrahydrodipicolinate synthase